LARLLHSVWCPKGKTQGANKTNHLRSKYLMSVAANNVFAAAFSVVISAGLFAYAIIPASPTLMA